MYGEWLALHLVLADNYVTHLFIYMLATTIKLSMLLKFWGCGYSHMHLRKHFLDLGLAVTEIIKKKSIETRK